MGAGFEGLYNYEDDQDPLSVKLSIGNFIILSGCIIVLFSVLQKEISLSTLE